MKKQDNISKDTWGKLIQVAIALLTVVSGMFFESCTHIAADVLAIL